MPASAANTDDEAPSVKNTYEFCNYFRFLSLHYKILIKRKVIYRIYIYIYIIYV